MSLPSLALSPDSLSQRVDVAVPFTVMSRKKKNELEMELQNLEKEKAALQRNLQEQTTKAELYSKKYEKARKENAELGKELKNLQFELYKFEPRIATAFINKSLAPYRGPEREIKTFRELKKLYLGEDYNGHSGYPILKVEVKKTASFNYFLGGSDENDLRRRLFNYTYYLVSQESQAHSNLSLERPEEVKEIKLDAKRVFYIYPDGNDVWTFIQGAGMYAPFIDFIPDSESKSYILISEAGFQNCTFTALPV